MPSIKKYVFSKIDVGAEHGDLQDIKRHLNGELAVLALIGSSIVAERGDVVISEPFLRTFVGRYIS